MSTNENAESALFPRSEKMSSPLKEKIISKKYRERNVDQ
jgi:hypothetical protein